ncbi:MAG: 3-oxoacyl-[acyl-carrier-protein] synthase [Actinomycetota bacterium]
MQGAGHRVAVTGYGVVAPCGVGKESFWKGLLGPGVVGAKTVELANWDPQPYFANPKEARRADRVEQFALAAAGEAITQSGELPYERSRIGSIFGTGIGGLRTLEEQVIVRVEKGERRVSPFLVPMMMSNACGAAISMRYKLQGPAETICTARRRRHRRCRIGGHHHRSRGFRQHDCPLHHWLQQTIRRDP